MRAFNFDDVDRHEVVTEILKDFDIANVTVPPAHFPALYSERRAMTTALPVYGWIGRHGRFVEASSKRLANAVFRLKYCWFHAKEQVTPLLLVILDTTTKEMRVFAFMAEDERYWQLPKHFRENTATGYSSPDFKFPIEVVKRPTRARKSAK